MNKKEWIDKCTHWKDKWPIFMDSYLDDIAGVNLYTFMEVFNTFSTKKDTVVCDAGSAIYVPSQNLKVKEGQTFILSGAQADMGFALPASVGVYLGDKNKNVCVITGDGSFNTNLQDLATISYHKYPIKVFIWNNGGYLSIRNTQINFFEGRVYGTGPKNGLFFPRINEIARLYNIDYAIMSSNEEMRSNMDSVLNAKNPMLIEVICKENQGIQPTQMFKVDENGQKYQVGLEDMYPFLPSEEIVEEMIKES